MIAQKHNKQINTLTSPTTIIMVTKMGIQKRTTIETCHKPNKLMVGKPLIQEVSNKSEVNTGTITTTRLLMEKIPTKQTINHLLKATEINLYNKRGTIQFWIKNPLINLQTLQTKTFLNISSIWLLKSKNTKSKVVVVNVPINLKTLQTQFIRIIRMKQNLV